MKRRIWVWFAVLCLTALAAYPISGTLAGQNIATPDEAMQSAEMTSEATATPGTEETAEPTSEPGAEPTSAPGASAEPNGEQQSPVPTTEAEATVTPDAEATAEPTGAPDTSAEPNGEEQSPAPTTEVEATAEPTSIPTAEPTSAPDTSAEPNGEEQSPAPTTEVEATAEPTSIPTAEPEIVIPELNAALESGVNHIFVGDGSIPLSLSISGGAAPYTVELKVDADGERTAEQILTVEAEGLLGMDYAPVRAGDHVISVKVTDAAEQEVKAAVSVPVAARVVEYAADWEATVAGVSLTGDWREDILAVAMTQLGYEESRVNFIIEDGVRRAYTRYGEWYGSAYAEWCGMFVSFCLKFADIAASEFPREANVQAWMDELNARNALERADYAPSRGDLIFLMWEDSDVPNHMGIVESVDGQNVYTIEGNAGGSVRRKSYPLDSTEIIGYANTAALMERAGVDSAQIGAPEMQLSGTAATARDSVNMRSKADQNSCFLRRIDNAGTEVALLGATDADGVRWYLAQYGETIGYIRGDLLALPAEPTAEPSAEPAIEPTSAPAARPTEEPEQDIDLIIATPGEAAVEPSAEPTIEPAVEPTSAPAARPTGEPEQDVDLIIATPDESAAEPDMTATTGEADGSSVHSAYAGDGENVLLNADAQGADVIWERGVQNEAGDMVWEEIASGAQLRVNADIESLKCVYRYVVIGGDGERMPGEPLALIDEPLRLWAQDGGVTMEMLHRAMNARSLESLVIEGDALIYVRTGEPIARYNAETRELTDIEYGIVIGMVDFETGMIVPPAAQDAPEEAGEARPQETESEKVTGDEHGEAAALAGGETQA